MLLAWITATFIYAAGTFLIVATLDPQELQGDDTPVATAGETFLDWLPQPLGLVLITAAALAAFASTANAGQLSASRYGLAMGRDGVVHGALAHIGRAGTPTYAILVTSGAMVLAILTLDVEQLAKLASAFQLLIFALLNLAVLVMREARLEGYRPGFRAPLYPYTQIFGLVVYVALIFFMGWLPVLASAAVIAVCIGWYLYRVRGQRHDGDPAINAVNPEQRIRRVASGPSSIAANRKTCIFL
jgi:basic amino acid/polyamine antiporter, APA family